MKIEIGESLVRSWLRHIEGCELAELNWKPSPVWPVLNSDDVETLYQRARSHWPEAFGRNSLSQLLKQSEVDVLGFSYSGGKPKAYFVDVAFHSNGLNYGAREVTAKRIYKKMVRSALISMTYFSGLASTIYFVSPVVSPATKSAVIDACNRAVTIFETVPTIKFQTIMAEDFKVELVDSVLNLEQNVADTSELFLRSWQLIAPFKNVICNKPTLGVSDIELESLPSENRKNTLVSALYLSKFGHQRLNRGNQGDTIRYMAEILDVKPNTLKNYRDRFDFYVDNHRVGWDAPLSEELQRILNEFSGFTEIDLKGYIGF